MKVRQIRELGIPDGESLELAVALFRRLNGGRRNRAAAARLRERLTRLAASPEDFLGDAELGPLARAVVDRRAARATFEQRPEPAPYQQWGADLEETSIQQMRNA